MNRIMEIGFTLLEVLIALAILAIALAAAVKGIGGYANNAAYLRNRTLAHWVAMNQVAEYQLRKEWPDIGKNTGTASQGNLEWYWQAMVSKTPDEDLRRVDIEVRFHKNDAEPTSTLTAFLGRTR